MFEEDATGEGRNLQFATVGPLASAANFTLIGGITGYKIKVVAYCIQSDLDNAITWRSGPTLRLSGAIALVNGGTNGVRMTGKSSAHLLETAPGDSLSLQASTNNAINGHLSYFYEPSVSYIP